MVWQELQKDGQKLAAHKATVTNAQKQSLSQTHGPLSQSLTHTASHRVHAHSPTAPREEMRGRGQNDEEQSDQ